MCCEGRKSDRLSIEGERGKEELSLGSLGGGWAHCSEDTQKSSGGQGMVAKGNSLGEGLRQWG